MNVDAAGESAGRRLDVLRVLKAASGPMSINQVAEALGVHPNTVRFHLDNLLDEERVEHAERAQRGPGRPALMFRPVRKMDPGGPRSYRLLAEILSVGLTADPDGSVKALAAGRAWGQRQVPPDPAEDVVDHLVDLLDDLGFAPQRRSEDGQLGLRHCPFLEIAADHQNVVCRMHLGLMQGALESWRSPVVVDRLDPFVEPDLCVAHLSTAAAR